MCYKSVKLAKYKNRFYLFILHSEICFMVPSQENDLYNINVKYFQNTTFT